MSISHSDTFPETNKSPLEKWWLGDEISFWGTYFQVVKSPSKLPTLKTAHPRDLFLRRLAVKFTPLPAAP